MKREVNARMLAHKHKAWGGQNPADYVPVKTTDTFAVPTKPHYESMGSVGPRWCLYDDVSIRALWLSL